MSVTNLPRPASLFGDRNPQVVTAVGLHASSIVAVGSRVTCNPPPADTDEDWLVLLESEAQQSLQQAGFTQEGSPEFYTGSDVGGFQSWRHGNINVITTPDPEFFYRFITATTLAKRFNLLKKADRIALFQAVLYGVDASNLEI